MYPSAECPLHEDSLRRIEAMCKRALDKLDALVSVGGPIAEVKIRLAVTEKGLEQLEMDVADVRDKLWTQALRAGGLGAGMTGAVIAALYALAKMIGGGS
jgi:hypothetical protein